MVSLNAPSARTVSVNYGTADGTATAGSDYNATSGQLTFAPGETRKWVMVPVRGDRLGEADEALFVRLRGAKNASVAGGQAVVTIVDDEPRLRIAGALGQEAGVGGAGLVSFAVTLSAAADAPVIVNYATADGTAYGYAGALAGSDYVAAAGTLTFAPGETTKVITIRVLDDAAVEPVEMFFLNLSAASANTYVVDGGQAIGAIDADPYWVEDPYPWWQDW